MITIRFVPIVDLVNGLIHGVKHTWEKQRSVPLLNNRADPFVGRLQVSFPVGGFFVYAYPARQYAPLVGGMRSPGRQAPRWWGFLK